MTISFKHLTQATGTDAGSGEIRKAQWNEEHSLTMASNYILGRASAGSGDVEEIACTAAGRALLDDANAAAQRTTLGLGVGSMVQFRQITYGATGTLVNFVDYVGTPFAMTVGGAIANTVMKFTDATKRLCFQENTLEIEWAFGTCFRISEDGHLRYLNGSSILVAGSGVVGYDTGAGGSITQITSKSTGVTINKSTGRVVTHNAALAAGASVSFTVTNGNVLATDVILVTVNGSADYSVESYILSAGQFSIRLTNISAGSLSQAVNINFAILRCVTA